MFGIVIIIILLITIISCVLELIFTEKLHESYIYKIELQKLIMKKNVKNKIMYASIYWDLRNYGKPSYLYPIDDDSQFPVVSPAI